MISLDRYLPGIAADDTPVYCYSDAAERVLKCMIRGSSMDGRHWVTVPSMDGLKLTFAPHFGVNKTSVIARMPDGMLTFRDTFPPQSYVFSDIIPTFYVHQMKTMLDFYKIPGDVELLFKCGGEDVPTSLDEMKRFRRVYMQTKAGIPLDDPMDIEMKGTPDPDMLKAAFLATLRDEWRSLFNRCYAAGELSVFDEATAKERCRELTDGVRRLLAAASVECTKEILDAELSAEQEAIFSRCYRMSI